MSLKKTNGGLRKNSLFPRTFSLNDFFDSDSALAEWEFGNGADAAWIPAANVKDDEKEFSIELSIPGYTKKEVKVEVDDNNILRIQGEHKDESEEKSENYTRKEFSYGTFERSFQLPDTVEDDKISAKCSDGVLCVVLPKKEKAVVKNKVKEVNVS